MKFITIIITIILIFNIICDIPHLNKKQINERIDQTKINYGSTIRIKANAFPY